LPKKANLKPSVDLKPLFWSKISDNKIKGTIWDPDVDVASKVKDADKVAAGAAAEGEEDYGTTEKKKGKCGINDADVDIDIELINAQFLKKKSGGAAGGANSGSGGGNKSKKKGPVTLLDGKRLQNVGIQLSRFSQRGLTSADIRSALLRCQEDVLTMDRLSGLLKIMPTQAEIELCMDYEGDASKLGKVEKFFRTLADVPHAKLRIEALMAKDQMEDQVTEVQDRLEAHANAIAQVKASLAPPSSDGISGGGVLRKLFQVVLRVGNYVNGGTRRGGAYGVQLDAVAKMASVKSSDNKSNLLRFCAKELASEKHAVVVKITDNARAVDEERKDDAGVPLGYHKCFAAGTGDLRAALRSLDKASKSPLEEILMVVSKMGKGVQVIRDCMEKCLEMPRNEGGESGDGITASETLDKNQQAVQACFSGFLDYAEGTRESLSVQLAALSIEGEKISVMFAENPKKVSSSEVYAKILKIVDAVENAYTANARDANNEAKRAKRDQKQKEKEHGKKKCIIDPAGSKHQRPGNKGTFAQHKMFQSGGATDIVARVRERNKNRSPSTKQQRSRMSRSSSMADWDDAPESAKTRAPAPPKPPPHLQALGK
jgi:hypothetical protein